MPNLTHDQRATLMNEGAFKGSKTLLARRAISEAMAQQIETMTFKAILVEIDEAHREIMRIQTSLSRMESSARIATKSKGPTRQSSYDLMTEHLITLDAWVVSLLETVLTITGILNPSHTRNKITELAKAMTALMDKRVTEQHPVLDDPALFRDYVDR